MSEIEKNVISLEKEIEKQLKKINIAESSIESDKLKLSYDIVIFTKLAWYLVVIGFVFALHGCINYAIFDKPPGFSLNLIGDYLSGTLSAIWSLAGLFFIYVSFLGQRQQILDQRLEMLYSQLDVKYTRLEMLGQKQELSNHRKEFEIDRITTIIYNQYNLFNAELQKLQYTNPQNIIQNRTFAIVNWEENVRVDLIEKLKLNINFKPNPLTFENLYKFTNDLVLIDIITILAKSLHILDELIKPFSQEKSNESSVHELKVLISNLFSHANFQTFIKNYKFVIEFKIKNQQTYGALDKNRLKVLNGKIGVADSILTYIEKMKYIG